MFVLRGLLFIVLAGNSYFLFAGKCFQGKDTLKAKSKVPELEQIFISQGLVNVCDMDSSIRVSLKYSTTDNFIGKDMYGDLEKCYLQLPVAKQLVKAQAFLKDTLPGLSLLVYDASRPLSIQQIMWDNINVPAEEKAKFLSPPSYGSLHNFGAAVDVTLIDTQTGKVLDMGTAYDSFDKKAYPALENYFLNVKALTKQQYANRKLLRRVMEQGLFSGIPTEWWHFNACRNKDARTYYKLIPTHTYKTSDTLSVKKVENALIEFKIQVKVSGKLIDLNSSTFKGLKVEYYQHKGLYKYITGKYSDLVSACNELEKIYKLGFTDAFVVAFNNGERIEIKEALELMP